MSYYRNNYGLMNHQTESYNKFSNLNIFSSPNNNLNNLNGLNSINFSQNKPPSNFRAKKKNFRNKKVKFRNRK